MAVDLVTNWGASGLSESEIYELKAAPGPLRIVLNEVQPSARVRVMLQDAESGEVLLDQYVRSGDPVIEHAIQKEGSYLLLVAPNQVKAVTVHGQDLVVKAGVPGIKLPTMKAFETKNAAFTVQAQIVGSPAASLELAVAGANGGGQVLAENAVRADGTVAPVTIDPATMQDGIYMLQATAAAKDSGNLAVNARIFLVDRVAAFTDVGADHWARRYVEVMAHLGIVSGRGTGTFAPSQPVTRAEFAKMLAGALNLQASGGSAAPFADMRSDWSKPYIQAMWEAGLIKGESVDGKLYYFPDRTISRAEAATIVGRVLGVDQRDVSAAKVSLIDYASVPTWARPSVVTLAEMKWVSGFPDGSYKPMATLNRDQAAKVLGNFVGIAP